jgi:hypothetical protein
MASSKMSSSINSTKFVVLDETPLWLKCRVSDTSAHASIKNVYQEGIKKDSDDVKLRKEIQTARETIAIKNTRMDQMELRQCEYTMEMDAIYRNSQGIMTGSRVELTKPAKDKDKKSFEKKFETASESESQSSQSGSS